ncbi:RluA family pseudouridine synthase [Candidatus Uabimicrobium amorphum]|uniref:Pseudouridine synthase n=1 Tax=Uabimicrobium amorphum TaxID=2596890 RepID=A0A5S9F238_UABAM|nr:RluA family pseudouridine synthase [Candidatus Uabimicrobium amorphum]BBM82713.1 pseudouridine synthase [Candidatus Uabimicrobium amorphum]
MKISILYEDENLIAVNKPPGLVCHPVGGYQGDTVISQLSSMYPENIHLLHRLDKNTSGVLLVTRGKRIIGKMYKQFARRIICKTYLAVVHGVVKFQQGIIKLPIARADESSLIKLKMTTQNPSGLIAQTNYKLLETTATHSLLHLQPITGRKHQIRLHLAAIGHPIVGDYLYTHSGVPFLWEYYLQRPSPWHETIAGHALHAHSIEFEHPVLGQQLKMTAPLPRHLHSMMKGF